MYKLSVLLLLVCSIFLFSCATETVTQNTETKSHYVAGNIVFEGTALIPNDAKIIVTLDDVSRMDTASITLGKQEKTGITHFPVSFELFYNPADIKEGMRYSVSARIEENGKLIFINDTHIPVFDDYVKSDPHEIILPVIQVVHY